MVELMKSIEKAKEHGYKDVVLPLPDIIRSLRDLGYTVTPNTPYKDLSEETIHIQWK